MAARRGLGITSKDMACGFTQCPAVWLEKDARAAMRLAMRLALSPDDDPSFERVLNVPARRLGAKLLQQLREEQEQLLAADRDSLLEQQQLQQQQRQNNMQQQQQQHSLYRIACRLLRNGDIAALHAGKLQAFLETLQAVTRAKQRLYLTVPQYRVAPNPHRQQTSWQADGRDDNVLAPSDFLNCLTRLAEVRLANDEPLLEAENLRSDRVFD
ncbi:hypothetical protein OEZ86_000463 [Tetradesmus obliquus]|nr:hypothetical protein OEZ86_000463 [Tetradesmus obliquus]